MPPTVPSTPCDRSQGTRCATGAIRSRRADMSFGARQVDAGRVARWAVNRARPPQRRRASEHSEARCEADQNAKAARRRAITPLRRSRTLRAGRALGDPFADVCVRPCCARRRRQRKGPMKRLLTLSVCATLALAGSAVAQDVRYNFDKSANFPAFKTYKWVAI